ncbi:MAG: SOS response-associated peptidase [Planctomycetota bacterium]
MCARYQLSVTAKKLAELFRAMFDERPDLYVPRYNIAPTSPVLIVREREVGQAGESPATIRRELAHVRWGLVPGWAKDIAIGAHMINARGESAATKPGFRGAMKYRRCIVPVSGFYEWKHPPTGTRGKKRPHHIRVSDTEAFGLAGLWESWQDPAGNELDTCTVLTCQPNEMIADLHDRMPVILDPKDYARWLNPNQQDAAAASTLLRPYPAERMEAWPVSTYVNKTGNEGPRCIEPVEIEGEQPGLFAGM